MNRLPLIFILLFSCLLFSENLDNQRYINEISDYLVNNSEDLDARINLGYYYMLDNNPLLALREYRYVTERDSSNLTAWQGVLWAYNAQYNWKQTTIKSKTAQKLFPQDPIIRNFTGYAYWNSYNALAARRLYMISNALAEAAGDTQAQTAALEGLGWIYQAYNDYSLARLSFTNSNNTNRIDSNSAGLKSLKKVKLNTLMSYANLENKKSSLTANQILDYKRLTIKTGLEQFKADGKKIRDSWSAGISYQTRPFVLEADAWLLKGNYNIYPAHIYQAQIMERYWFNDMMLKPTYRFAYSHYPDFNVYQNALNLDYSVRRTTLGATVVHSRRDVENLNADETYLAYHGSLSYIMNKGVILGLTAGHGRQDWYVSSLGYIVDTNITNKKYIGNSILFPLSGKVDLIYYHQLGYKQKIWHYTGSVTLSVSY